MPYDEPESSDPSMLVGVATPAGAEAMRDMAYVFAEEFARMGHDVETIVGLFRNPFYVGAHGAYQSLGPDEVCAIVDECVEVWGRAAGNIQDGPPAGATDAQRLPWPASTPAMPMAD